MKKEYTKNFRKLVLLVIGILLASFGMSLLIKCNLGQSTVSGISYNIGFIMNMKAGTILAIINYICFLIQILMLGKDFKLFQFFQLGVTVIFSNCVNYFTYDMPFISELAVNNYIVNIGILLTGICFMAYGVSLMIKVDLVYMPFEGFCKVLAEKLNIKFGTLKLYVDGTLVICSVALILLFSIPNTSVREGTIVYACLFGPLANIFMKSIRI